LDSTLIDEDVQNKIDIFKLNNEGIMDESIRLFSLGESNTCYLLSRETDFA